MDEQLLLCRAQIPITGGIVPRVCLRQGSVLLEEGIPGLVVGDEHGLGTSLA